MDWALAPEDQARPFYMDFEFDGSGDVWNFDAPLDFGPTSVDLAPPPFGTTSPFDPQPLDPAFISPESPGELASDGGPAPSKYAHRRRDRKMADLPNLNTELSDSAHVVHGQITPAPSATSSPPTHALDAIDPTAVMPGIEDSQPELLTVSMTAVSGTDAATRASFAPTHPTSTTGAAATATEPKPKSKRGRKKKILAPAARAAQRACTLARNRAAAQRCRQRKKVEHSALEQRARTLTKERARLHALVGGLRDELLSLKGTMLRHAGCADADSPVARYVAQQREMLMTGIPSGLELKTQALEELEELLGTRFDDSEDDKGADDADSDEGKDDDQDVAGQSDGESPPIKREHPTPPTKGKSEAADAANTSTKLRSTRRKS